MLKPLTLSLSLAVALGLCSVSKAGLHDGNCATCGLASPQGVVASAQGPIVSSCGAPCAPKHKLFSGLGGHLSGLKCKMSGLLHPPVTYEWVLKKKHNWFHGGGCDTCGSAAPVYATGQAVPSGQYAAPQAAPQVYGAGQHTFMPARSTTTIASVPTEMTPATPGGEEVPPAPEVNRETSANGPQNGLLLPTPSGN